jgi:ribA/ribD-fused uncharacterized protein
LQNALATEQKHRERDDRGHYQGDRILVEASPVDAIWGIGLAADDPKVMQPELWPGENLLGFALMVVRERLRNL